ncbi:hypothetical protein TGPRC2_204520 [Toxoplasma gondii TgCatPRC2]|uniref:Uncharacterized protein n=1 Tax=Toxoplasma gondii TgCatPRC2 TaxID=1130821 RepID=A0A151HAJ4_TOXGO|nr:hypothetical protein TGPRC2_204520 [Toxoplasma gondii TgCatPRC2]
MRSALFLGTFFIGISAASASSAIGAGSVEPLEELQRLAAEYNDGRNQLDAPDALEKLQEAQRASQSFANRNFKENDVGDGLLPNNDEPWEEQSVDSSVDVEERALEQKTDFLAQRPQPEKAAVYRELQVFSTGSAGPEENGDEDERQNDPGQLNVDENQPDIERNEIPEDLDDHSEESENEETALGGNGFYAAQESDDKDPDVDVDNEVDGVGFMLEGKENELTDLEAPGNESTGSTEEESEEERILGKRRYYYAAPKKTQPPPKKIAAAPKKAPPVKVPLKVHEKKVVPPPKKVVRPAKKYVPVQKKAPPPKKVYAPPPKKVYAPPPKKVYAPPKKAYAPPPKKVSAPKKYVPVSKKGGY